MTSFRDVCKTLPELKLDTRGLLIEQGKKTGKLYVLIDGELAIFRDGIEVAKVSDAGAIFGEMSVLLDTPHSATVIADRPSRVHVVEDGAAFLKSSPEVMAHLAQVLALRLHLVTGHLANLKQQLASEGTHARTIDEIFECLYRGQEAGLARR